MQPFIAVGPGIIALPAWVGRFDFQKSLTGSKLGVYSLNLAKLSTTARGAGVNTGPM